MAEYDTGCVSYGRQVDINLHTFPISKYRFTVSREFQGADRK